MKEPLLNRAIHQLVFLSAGQAFLGQVEERPPQALRVPGRGDMSSESWTSDVWASALCLLFLPSAYAFPRRWSSQKRLTGKGTGSEEGVLESQAAIKIQGCKSSSPIRVSELPPWIYSLGLLITLPLSPWEKGFYYLPLAHRITVSETFIRPSSSVT